MTGGDPRPYTADRQISKEGDLTLSKPLESYYTQPERHLIFPESPFSIASRIRRLPPALCTLLLSQVALDSGSTTGSMSAPASTLFTADQCARN